MKTDKKLLKLLDKHGQLTVQEMSEALDVSRQYVHQLLIKLDEAGTIMSVGKAPRVFYMLKQRPAPENTNSVSPENEVFLNQHFILVNPLGEMLEGIPAMNYWCEKQGLPFEKTVSEFMETRNKYLSYFNADYLIDGVSKLKNTKGMGEIGVDELYYLDFYAMERFGKTRLGTLMHYAKQGQNKQLMKRIADEIRNRLIRLLKEKQIDAILFVPPTIDRKVQILTVLQKLLHIDKPYMKVEKIRGSIMVPQKALSKLYERIENAKNTFYLPHQKAYKRVLILDDAVGSGATINEIALKLKSKALAKEIVGLAITGSYKGFEVISEL
jgi:DNA-binding transcriptional ArsR family regulator